MKKPKLPLSDYLKLGRKGFEVLNELINNLEASNLVFMLQPSDKKKIEKLLQTYFSIKKEMGHFEKLK